MFTRILFYTSCARNSFESLMLLIHNKWLNMWLKGDNSNTLFTVKVGNVCLKGPAMLLLQKILRISVLFKWYNTGMKVNFYPHSYLYTRIIPISNLSFLIRLKIYDPKLSLFTHGHGHDVIICHDLSWSTMPI
jgi:hypothetical protein